MINRRVMIVEDESDKNVRCLFINQILRQSFSMGGMPVYFGGPNNRDKVFILHTKPNFNSKLIADSKMTKADSIYSTCLHSDNTTINNWGRYFAMLGCLEISRIQLENEIAKGIWLSCGYSYSILFEVPPVDRGTYGLKLIEDSTFCPSLDRC